MEDLGLARAYVSLDRFVYFRLQNASTFVNVCEDVREQLREVRGSLDDFKELCEAGADSDELLWLLHGCEGLAGFTDTQEVFGWTAKELSKALATVETAASAIEKMRYCPFGLIAVQTPDVRQGLEKTLRAYVALARAARRDFGYRSDWFLNIAKARLVIHVAQRTNGAFHDREISGVISAVIGTNYDAATQSRWRHKYRNLVRDASLDPYTVMTPAERESRRKSWEQTAAQAPEFYDGFGEWVAAHNGITEARRPTKPQKHKK
jgi:hypothetical protein